MRKKRPKINKPDLINRGTGGSWVYSKTVKSHFFKPRNFLPKDPPPGSFDAEGIVGSPACILPTTLVQKNPIPGLITEARIGEEILSHDGYFHPIQRIFRPMYKADLIRLRNPLGEIVTSPDHLIFAMQIPRKANSPFVHTKDKQKVPPSWVHAGDLKKGDIVLYPIPKVTRKISSITLPVFTRKKYDFKSRLIPSEIPLNEEVLELFGYFIAEGYIKHDNSVVGFTFSNSELAYAERVKQLLKKYFVLSSFIHHRTKNNRIDVSSYNVHLAHTFHKWFGSSASTKQVPEFILLLPHKIQRGIVRGLWRGDGYLSTQREYPRAGFATISKTLLHQVVWLLLRQKVIPSIYQEAASIKRGVSHKKSFRLHVGDMISLERLAAVLKITFRRDPSKYHTTESWFDDNYLYIPIRNVSTLRFEGRLVNFEIAESQTYATDAFLIHNCGDVMRVWLKIDPRKDKITACKWRTFGCASALAATSVLSVMVTEKSGMKLDKAMKIQPRDIIKRLGGLPDRKIHCSVLGDKSLRAAINNWFKKTGQYDRIAAEDSRIIDPQTKVTEADIEEAVIEGALNLKEVQQRTKVGIGYPQCLPEVEELIRFYKEKYFG